MVLQWPVHNRIISGDIVTSSFSFFTSARGMGVFIRGNNHGTTVTMACAQ